MASGRIEHRMSYIRSSKAFRVFSLILLVAIAYTHGVTAIPQAEKELSDYLREASIPDATNLTSECMFHVSENETKQFALTDASLSTTWESSQDAYVEITAPDVIGSVYIEWAKPPENWTLLTERNSELVERGTYGESGFINEFVTIRFLPSRIMLRWDQQKTRVSIARISVFSPGKVPPDVQQWNKPYEKADMLLISTHADDEHLYFGGAMPVYAGERKKKVQVAYFVNHGLLRTRELLAGLWVVGISHYPLLSDFPDHYVDSYQAAERFYGLDKSLEFQVMLLRRFKPEVVLGHDLDGEYGHGAHMLNAKTLTMALDLASDSNQYLDSAQDYGVWEVKKCYLHLYEEKEIIMDWTLPLSFFGGRSGWEMAIEGYQYHVSQHHFKFRVRIEGPNDCRKFGLYRSTVGSDVLKNDFFENIMKSVPTDMPSPTTIPTAIPAADSTTNPDSTYSQHPSNDEFSSSITTPLGQIRGGYFLITGFGIVVIALLTIFFVAHPGNKKTQNRKKLKKEIKGK
jgi:LmbE family N-acetylglucosaminyl deacetylase